MQLYIPLISTPYNSAAAELRRGRLIKDDGCRGGDFETPVIWENPMLDVLWLDIMLQRFH